ncbi:ABC transporter permease [Spirosoma rigui]|uniref:ABC transporter permease n=1 Tax=Spirosoma rigui TaxID=564064 RepID=UPI0009AFD585|nr:ABC transporter permease [Spirosoma rigui]
MLQNYLKIAFRTLWKDKSSTFINVIGLAVAFYSSTMLFMTVALEHSFDRFHRDYDRIFRTYSVTNHPDGVRKSANMPLPFVPALRQEFPELDGATRYQEGGGLVRFGSKQLDKEIDGVDPDFLTMFSFPLLQGNARQALASLSSIVITQNMAHDVFGSVSPVGKTLAVNSGGSWKTYIVTGVLADVPDNSSMQFDALVRIENQPGYQESKSRWDNLNHAVYIKLKPTQADPATVEKRLQPFTRKYYTANIRDLKQQGAKPDERGDLFGIRLQPLLDVHGNGNLTGSNASRTSQYALTAIGLFILLIAAINFVNLTLGRSFVRAREVGVRKSLGAQKYQLFVQLWGETILTCAVGLVIGTVLMLSLRTTFNALFGAKLTLATLFQPSTLVVALGSFLLMTLVAGGYPALVMSRFQTVQVLKGRITGSRPSRLRNSLIIAQFTITCLLMVGTLVVLLQTNYLRNQPLGFDQEQVISIPVGGEVDGRVALQQLRNRLAGNPGVVAVSGTDVNLGRGLDGGTTKSVVTFMHKGREISSNWLRVDYDYIKTLGIKLQAGREFNRQYPTDTTSALIVSAGFAKKLGNENPVGTFFQMDSAGVKYQIIGLVPDFHLYNLREKIEPVAMHIRPEAGISYILVRTVPDRMLSVMESLKTEWRQIAPRTEFAGSFLNQNTERWYRQEKRMATMLSIAAGLAITLSCMGLFAIALLTIQQRTKEIGVRKVLGASVGSIVALLSAGFLKLVVMALLVASPLAWWAMNEWLTNFAYHIDIPWWVFALTALLALTIAFLTVSVQSIKAALMNPINSLHSE